MKKIILLILILFVITLSSCSNNNKTHTLHFLLRNVSPLLYGQVYDTIHIPVLLFDVVAVYIASNQAMP